MAFAQRAGAAELFEDVFVFMRTFLTRPKPGLVARLSG